MRRRVRSPSRLSSECGGQFGNMSRCKSGFEGEVGDFVGMDLKGDKAFYFVTTFVVFTPSDFFSEEKRHLLPSSQKNSAQRRALAG